MHKLRAYLLQEGLSAGDFAVKLTGHRYDRASVLLYMRGAMTPSPRTLDRIEEITNGFVQPIDFYLYARKYGLKERRYRAERQKQRLAQKPKSPQLQKAEQ
jgi:predicted transcriptional regulator